MSDSQGCPPFPAGSIDFNAVHAAARQNHDLGKAVEEACTRPDDKGAAPEETAPPPADAAEVAQPVQAAADPDEGDTDEGDTADNAPSAPKRGK